MRGLMALQNVDVEALITGSEARERLILAAQIRLRGKVQQAGKSLAERSGDGRNFQRLQRRRAESRGHEVEGRSDVAREFFKPCQRVQGWWRHVGDFRPGLHSGLRN